MDNLNDTWIVEFETHSRDSAIKACTILARGLSIEGETSILIMGGYSGGKSMIVDAVIRDLSDNDTAFKMPRKGTLESRSDEASVKYLSKMFNHNGRKFIGAFYRDGLYPADKLNIALGEAKSKFFNPLRRRVVFKTGRDHEDNFDCVINLCEPLILEDMGHGLDGFGTRKWKIEIHGDHLKTARMKMALDHLRIYESRRHKRMERCLVA